MFIYFYWTNQNDYLAQGFKKLDTAANFIVSNLYLQLEGGAAPKSPSFLPKLKKKVVPVYNGGIRFDAVQAAPPINQPIYVDNNLDAPVPVPGFQYRFVGAPGNFDAAPNFDNLVLGDGGDVVDQFLELSVKKQKEIDTHTTGMKVPPEAILVKEQLEITKNDKSISNINKLIEIYEAYVASTCSKETLIHEFRDMRVFS